MTAIKSLSGAILLAAGAFALSSATASARVICNEWGQCWRVHGHDHPGWAYPGWGWSDRPYARGWQEEGGSYGGWGERESHGHWQWEEE